MTRTQSNEDRVLPQVMSVVFMCGWGLYHVCYQYITGLLQPRNKDCGKCMLTCLCSLGILHGAHCMRYLLLHVIHLMSEKYVH